MAFLFQEKLSGTTVKNYLAAVRYTQISFGLGDPEMSKMPQLEYVVKDLKRSSVGPKRTRLPITPEILRRLKGVWLAWPNRRDAYMLWAAVTMCFCGFLRSGKVVVPSQTGYEVMSRHHISVLVMSAPTVSQTFNALKSGLKHRKWIHSEWACQYI